MSQPQQQQWNQPASSMGMDQDMSGGMPGDDQMAQAAGPAQTNNQKTSERMRLDESEW